MGRIKIELPGTFIYSTSLNVRVTDLNYGNHLGNDALLGLIHEARLTFLRSMGCNNEKNVFGAGLIMADSGIIYKAEGYLGDTLKIEIAVNEFTRVGFEMVYRVMKETNIVVAIAKTGMVFFDYDTRKIVPVPQPFLDAIAVM